MTFEKGFGNRVSPAVAQTLEKYEQRLIKAGILKLTREEAHADNRCINCGEPAFGKIHTEAGMREYALRGMCEECFDYIFLGDRNGTTL